MSKCLHIPHLVPDSVEYKTIRDFFEFDPVFLGKYFHVVQLVAHGLVHSIATGFFDSEDLCGGRCFLELPLVDDVFKGLFDVVIVALG